MKKFKKFILLTSIALLLTVLISKIYAYTISTESGNSLVVKKIYFASVGASETVTFGFEGMAVRIVVDATNVDADGDITISDMSGYNYLSLTNPLAAATEISYIISSVDSSANAYGGCPIGGVSTMTLSTCESLGATYIYIYLQR